MPDRPDRSIHVGEANPQMMASTFAADWYMDGLQCVSGAFVYVQNMFCPCQGLAPLV
jgi:hypothetical protein